MKNIVQLAKNAEMYSEMVVFSREKAAKTLELAPKNRNVIQSAVNSLCAEMLSPHWIPNNPQGLIFNKDGQLIDGQHRLLAFLKSGLESIQFYCTFNVDDNVKVVLDGATPRRLDQTGQILGLETSVTSIAITKCLFIKVGDKKPPKITDKQLILQTYSDFKDGIELASVRTCTGSITSASIRSVVARAYYAGSHKSSLKRFIEVLDTGFSENSSESAAIALRNIYLGLPAKKMNLHSTRISLWAKSITALSRFLQGEPCRTLPEAKIQLFPLDGID